MAKQFHLSRCSFCARSLGRCIESMHFRNGAIYWKLEEHPKVCAHTHTQYIFHNVNREHHDSLMTEQKLRSASITIYEWFVVIVTWTLDVITAIKSTMSIYPIPNHVKITFLPLSDRKEASGITFKSQKFNFITIKQRLKQMFYVPNGIELEIPCGFERKLSLPQKSFTEYFQHCLI